MKWQQMAAKQRQRWLAQIEDIPIRHRRYRLEVLQRLLEKTLSQEPSEAGRETRIQDVLKIIDQARKEAEGEPSPAGNALVDLILSAAGERDQ